jgi:hypothetical protein
VRNGTYEVDVYTCALSIGLCEACMTRAREQAKSRLSDEIDRVRRVALALEEQEAVVRSVQQELERELLQAQQALEERRAQVDKARVEARQSLERRKAEVKQARENLKDAENGLEEARKAKLELKWDTEDKEGLLTFGKHKGRHILTIWSHLKDQHFVVWLEGYSGRLDHDRADRAERHELCHVIPKEIMDRAHKLLVGKCRRCFSRVDADWKTWCTACFRDLSS